MPEKKITTLYVENSNSSHWNHDNNDENSKTVITFQMNTTEKRSISQNKTEISFGDSRTRETDDTNNEASTKEQSHSKKNLRHTDANFHDISEISKETNTATDLFRIPPSNVPNDFEVTKHNIIQIDKEEKNTYTKPELLHDTQTTEFHSDTEEINMDTSSTTTMTSINENTTMNYDDEIVDMYDEYFYSPGEEPENEEVCFTENTLPSTPFQNEAGRYSKRIN